LMTSRGFATVLAVVAPAQLMMLLLTVLMR
jgi:hypothetical protein